MSQLLWDPLKAYPTSSSNSEQTWIVNKEFKCSNLTHVTFKAGSKDYALHNDNIGGTTTELGLKKKYR